MSDDKNKKALATIDRIVLFLLSHNVDEDIYPLDDITTIRTALNPITEEAREKANIAEMLGELSQLRAENERLRGALRLILLLAKGYVNINNVGSNQDYIEIVEEALAPQIGRE